MVKSLAENKSVFRLEIKDKLEAGLVLTGDEVKSIRQGQVVLSRSFVKVTAREAFLFGMRVHRYGKSGQAAAAADRSRKLLLRRGEIGRLSGLLSQKGTGCVPLEIYLKGSFIKVKIGVGRLPRKWEKKDKIIERQETRDTNRVLQGGF